MTDFYKVIESAMKKANPDVDEFTRLKAKHNIKPKRKRKDVFVKNLDRIVESLERRKINKKQAIKKLQMLID